MRYTDNYYEEEKQDYSLYVYITIIMIAVVVAVIGLIFWTNKPKGTSKGFQIALAQSTRTTQLKKQTDEVVKSVDELITGSTLTSDQLDIWTLPDTGRADSALLNDTKNGILTNKTTGETLTKQDESVLQEEVSAGTFLEEETVDETEEETAPLTENEFELTLSDGSKKLITINEEIPKNEWKAEQFTYQKPVMKYCDGEEQISTFGVDLSSLSGDVDFTKLKRAGCNFIMVRVGQRGYASGKMIMDASYEEYIDKAIKAGIEVGLYFNSQAITKEEILEEADCVLSVAEDYKITYPIMFDMESIEGDMARTDALDNDMRTRLASTFLKKIKDSGQKPVLYGNKEWLLAKLNLEELTDFDICYAQDGKTPDYPYQFSMWNYQNSASIAGVENDTRLFVNMKSYE